MRDGIARVARIFDGLLQPRIEVLRATIEMDEDCVRRTAYLSDGSINSAAMKWTGISRIVAFKRDLLIADLLCVGLTDRQGVMIVDEEMEGFEEMIQAFPSRLQGAPSEGEWWLRVVKPAFATNFTVIFRREQS
jgi:hypothetical protein